ncbi:hypothetical protein DIPPA_29974 [Diplonema papillatum]|nr:hypothetical protein DIPPA_29974 [Diplonema papillatum]
MATDMTVEEAERQLAAIEADTAEAVAPLKQRVEELEVDRAVRRTSDAQTLARDYFRAENVEVGKCWAGGCSE